MKSYVIGKTKTRICESIEDLNIKRYVAVKQFMITQESGYDLPSLRKIFTDLKDNFDEKKASKMLLTIYEYIISIKHVQEMDDADQMIFALITLDEGEQPDYVDKTHLKEKLNKYAAEGLTQGEIKREVANFIHGSIFN